MNWPCASLCACLASAGGDPNTTAAPDATADAPEQIDVESSPAPDAYYSPAFAESERFLNVMTARPVRRNSLMSVINHRNGVGVGDSPGYNLLGFLGGGLQVGLGLRYGAFDHLDVGIFVVNHALEPFNTYAYDARYQLLQQQAHGIDVALYGGGTWFHQQNVPSASAWFAQVLASRIIGDRLVVGANAAYHSSSSNPEKSTTDTLGTLALGAAAEVRINDTWAYDAEVTFPVAGYGAAFPAFSTGPKVITNRHTFSVLFSNTQALSLDETITGTSIGKFAGWVLGFVITREID